MPNLEHHKLEQIRVIWTQNQSKIRLYMDYIGRISLAEMLVGKRPKITEGKGGRREDLCSLRDAAIEKQRKFDEKTRWKFR